MVTPSFLELYQQIIAIPTISSDDSCLDQSNYELVTLLANWLNELGFSIDIQPVSGSQNKYNLLASIGEGPGGLLLAGHTDTVPFDQKRWTRDPFKLSCVDNKLYGLGSADMKGFFAFVIDAVRHLDKTKLKKPLYILATADEETSMAGAIDFASTAAISPDLAIIGEPTNLIPVRAHKGHTSIEISVQGKSGHSSDPAKGINAIEIMHDVISQLMQLRQKLQQNYINNEFDIPYPTLNFGLIQGGDSANRICGDCRLLIDCRPIPGFSLTDLDELLQQALAPIKMRWPQRINMTESHQAIPAYACPVDNPALLSVEKIVGKQAITVNYCTEAPFIQQLCPTIILGPGSIEQAHQPDEYMATSFIDPTRNLLDQLIYRFCLKG